MAAITGTTGDDILTSTADDTLTGLAGDDKYGIDSYKDTVVEAVGGGMDTVYLNSNFNFGRVRTYTLSDNVENLDASALAAGATLNGTADINTITGSTKNDTLYGGNDAQKDTLIGGEGSDTYIIQDAQDVITETGIGFGNVDTVKLAANFGPASYTLNNANIEVLDASSVAKTMSIAGNAASATTIYGGSGNDTLTGGTGIDALIGGAGNDVLVGGNDSNIDVLTGGAGDDTYIIHDKNDKITEALRGGTDTLRLVNPLSDIDLTLYANIENADASGVTVNTALNGNNLVNTITGGNKNDTLYGGNDALSDTLIGGNGSDTYVIQDTLDVISEAGVGAGDIDTVLLASNYDDYVRTPTTATYTLNNSTIEALDGHLSSKNLTLTGNATTATTITGGIGNDVITGGAAADNLIGGVGSDTLFGGIDAAADTLSGGSGSDTYILNDTKDTITEVSDGFANTIRINNAFTDNSLSLKEKALYDYTAANIATIDASAITSKGVALTGNATAATTIYGGSGNDTMTGGTGIDTLIGGAGNDVLDGGNDSAIDILTGGTGDDTYIIHDKNDKITEALNAGTDTLKLVNPLSDIDLTLYANIENADASGVTVNTALNGNTLANTITGGSKNDTLYGGNDALRDTLIGGNGSDAYIIQDTMDVISESGIGVGDIDTVLLASNYDDYVRTPTTATYTLNNSTIEALDGHLSSKNLTLTGNATTATTITGGSGNDTITGGKAADTLIGGLGNDTYIIDSAAGINSAADTIIEGSDAGIDTLKLVGSANVLNMAPYINVENVDASAITTGTTINGNSLANTIIGSAKNDTLFGGNDTQSDTLIGGNGSDTYIIQDTQDVITETGTGAGDIDSIKLALNFSPDSYTLGTANIEALDGSSLTKSVTLTGSAKTATTITGGTKADSIIGGLGNDILDGGADSLKDTLTGGAGNDTYLIHDDKDKIVEGSEKGSGTDTLKLDASFNLPSLDLNSYDNVENIDASALSKSIILTGNGTANTLIGGKASDILYGGNEADTLIGGKGSDLYYVSSASNKVVEQANEGYDKVILSSGFKSSAFSLISNVEFLDATSVNQSMSLTGSSDTATTIFATNYKDVITGGSDSDTIMGFAGDDKINGLAGNDFIDGGVGADTIYGGAGNDIIYGGDDSVSDSLIGGDGQDIYYLKDTKDTITDTTGGNEIRIRDIYKESGFSLANNAVADDGSSYNYSAADITLLDASDVSGHGLTLTGSNVLNKVVTTVTTPATETTPAVTTSTTTYTGKDIEIIATSYDDFVASYTGNDTLMGGYGTDTLYGYGDDTLYGGAGTNVLLGGVGDDTYLIDGTETATTITELADTDDTKYGVDTIKLIGANNAFANGVDFTKLYTPGKLNGLDSYSISLASYANVENIDASLITNTNLTLTGNELGNTITGGSGNDVITGGSKNDTLFGGDGNDTLSGGQGLNTLDGGNGDDIYKISLTDEESVDGNAWKADKQADDSYIITVPKMMTVLNDSDGIDTIVLTGKESYSKDFYETFKLTMPTDIDNLDASAITKDLGLDIQGNALDNIITGGTGFDTINSGGGDDTIYDYLQYVDPNGVIWTTGNLIDAGDGNNTIKTGFGNDNITAGTGDDFIYDLGGSNTIDAGGGNNSIYTDAGNDRITTGSGNDYIMSGSGKDIINAGDGNDTIIGGTGNDTLTGGNGANVYRFSGGDNKDVITSTNSTDIIAIDTATGITKEDVLFYTDAGNNLYIDYTDNAVGSDVVKLNAGSYDDATTIQVGSNTININTITQYLASSGSTCSGLDAAGISSLSAANEAAQALTLVWTS